MEEEIAVPEVQEEAKPTGRDKFLSRMKEKNPEYAPESDDALLDDVDSLYTERENQLDKFSNSNKMLADLVAQDPKIGAVLSMILGEGAKSFPYAVAKIYGKEVFELEGEELEDFEAGYQENLTQMESTRAEIEKAAENIKSFEERFNAYVADKEEGEAQELKEKIFAMAESFLMGDISDEIIEYVDKGVNYDRDVQEAADTGFVEGKNEKIDLKKKTVQEMPDLNNTTGAGAAKPRPSKSKGSFYDGIQE